MGQNAVILNCLLLKKERYHACFEDDGELKRVRQYAFVSEVFTSRTTPHGLIRHIRNASGDFIKVASLWISEFAGVTMVRVQGDLSFTLIR